jgi:hypothetical protein
MSGIYKNEPDNIDKIELESLINDNEPIQIIITDTEQHEKNDHKKFFLSKDENGSISSAHEETKEQLGSLPSNSEIETRQTTIKHKRTPENSFLSIDSNSIFLNRNYQKSNSICSRKCESTGYDSEHNKRIIINVGGSRFETYLATLKLLSDSRLANMSPTNSDYDPVKDEYFFDRDPNSFQAILNYFRTGKLHAPNSVCGNLFYDELNFWGIGEHSIQPCCWTAYSTKRDCDEILKKVMDELDPDGRYLLPYLIHGTSTHLQRHFRPNAIRFYQNFGIGRKKLMFEKKIFYRYFYFLTYKKQQIKWFCFYIKFYKKIKISIKKINIF